MKKASIVLLLILFRLFNLSAVQTSSDKLTINAYKMGSISNTESLILKVYDAVTGSLDSIANNGKIIKIDNYISGTEDSHNNKLLGNVNNNEQGKLIFAIHAEGNTIGSYTVTVKMSPLAYKKDSNQVDVNERIPFYFHLMNNLAYFKKSESKTVVHEGNTYTITEGSVGSGIVVADDTNKHITFTWNVRSATATAPNITGNDVWVYHGGIGMVISKEDYEKAPNGNYATDVTVTLEVN